MVQRVDLVGRETELADLVSRVRERRLVTVTGPGGIGKTTLSRAAAELMGPEFEYGAIVVDLTRIDTPEGVAEAVAHQLGLADFESLISSPSDQPALIVFDNCEHVLDAAAHVTASLLDACAMPSIVATSRSPLDLPGESVLTLGPLDVPADDSSEAAAVVLFETRVADIGATLAPDDGPLVAEIVRRLDGVPLAIELAAARLRTRSLAELLAELDARPHELARPRFRGQPSHRSVADLVGVVDRSSRRRSAEGVSSPRCVRRPVHGVDGRGGDRPGRSRRHARPGRRADRRIAGRRGHDRRRHLVSPSPSGTRGGAREPT